MLPHKESKDKSNDTLQAPLSYSQISLGAGERILFLALLCESQTGVWVLYSPSVVPSLIDSRNIPGCILSFPDLSQGLELEDSQGFLSQAVQDRHSSLAGQCMAQVQTQGFISGR